MNRILVFIMLTCGFCLGASADVWKYVDEEGNTHFVDSNAAIYTWVDDIGKRHYADMPGHETAVAVQLVWHSAGDLTDLAPGGGSAQASGSNEAYPGETDAEREKRQQAEAYYCERAEQIYDSYLKAPRLYKADKDGARVYLSDEEAATTLTETKARVDELCN
jgi:hypothetical protein